MKHLKLLLIVALVASVFFNFRQCNKQKTSRHDYSQLLQLSSDSLETYRNENGKLVAHNAVIVTQKEDLQLLTDHQDDQIKHLAKLVKEKEKSLKSATALSTITQLDTMVITEILKGDTVFIVKTEFKDKWIDLKTETDLLKDSSKIDIIIQNDFLVWKEYSKRGKWPKREKYLRVSVLSENPYTAVDSLRSYEIPMKRPRRLVFGPVAAYGINQNLDRQFFLGAGLMYRIF